MTSHDRQICDATRWISAPVTRRPLRAGATNLERPCLAAMLLRSGRVSSWSYILSIPRLRWCGTGRGRPTGRFIQRYRSPVLYTGPPPRGGGEGPIRMRHGLSRCLKSRVFGRIYGFIFADYSCNYFSVLCTRCICSMDSLSLSSDDDASSLACQTTRSSATAAYRTGGSHNT